MVSLQTICRRYQALPQPVMNRMKPNSTLLIKYGGNAMTDPELQADVMGKLAELKHRGHRLVIVHGGGPFIRSELESAGIRSTFVDGQRVTSPEAVIHVEKALKGLVNGRLVSLLNACGCRAVGLSGKDGKMVMGRKRTATRQENGTTVRVDMGQVADIELVDTALIRTILELDMVPVIACLATDEKGSDFNVNADIMAGHIAGALQTDGYIVLTDVDGLLSDPSDPGSLLTEISAGLLEELQTNGVISGGMIPKVESCLIALRQGVSTAMIMNGRKPERIGMLPDQEVRGTSIKLSEHQPS